MIGVSGRFAILASKTMMNELQKNLLCPLVGNLPKEATIIVNVVGSGPYQKNKMLRDP